MLSLVKERGTVRPKCGVAPVRGDCRLVTRRGISSRPPRNGLSTKKEIFMSVSTIPLRAANKALSEVMGKIVSGSALAICLPLLALALACAGNSKTTPSPPPPAFPLVLVANANLTGTASRFDYQEIDPTNKHLVIAHMDDNSVVVVNLSDGSVVQTLPNIPVPRGIAVASSVGRIFVSSSGTPNQLYIFDSTSLTQIGTAPTGNAPDGVSWDPKDMIVGVSDQGDGAVSLIAGSGSGTRTQVILSAVETGNVLYDASRGQFWVTAVNTNPPDQLVSIDPLTAAVVKRIDLPGCQGAHGLRLHPDNQSALVACEINSVLLSVDLGAGTVLATAPVGNTPDVLSVDSGNVWLYVAAESGELTVFDLNKTGLVKIDDETIDSSAHTVAVDPATHRSFFPLQGTATGTPVLRILRPGP